MADSIYKQYVDKLSDMLANDSNFDSCIESISNGRSSFQISQKFLKRDFNSDWIEIIEEVLPSIDAIVRNPRRFITVEEDIIDISLAKQISVESVKHLAQHTHFISSANDKKGTVTPSKILNTSKEESFEVYENRFLYTLILKLYEFINKKYELIKKSYLVNFHEIKVSLNAKYHFNGADMNVSLVASTDVPFDEDKLKETQMYQLVQRVEKIRQIVQGFLSSSFAKEMKSSALVRPPITRTNVIKKEPNFKKALVLWQFIESYEKKGFETAEVNDVMSLPEELIEPYNGLLFLNSAILEDYVASFGERTLKEEYKPIDIEEKIRQEFDDDDEDFPSLNLQLREVRKVYAKHIGDKTYSQKEYRILTSAIDRVITQHRINLDAKNTELRKRLEAKQKKEDERLKQIAINEKRNELKRKQKELEEEYLRKSKERKALIKEEKEKELAKSKAEKERKKLMIQELLEKQAYEDKINDFINNLEQRTNKDIMKFVNNIDVSINKELKKQVDQTKKDIALLKKQKLEEYSKLLDLEINKLIDNEYEKVEN